jgi:hypothetical protein
MPLFIWRWRLGILKNRVKLKCQGLRFIFRAHISGPKRDQFSNIHFEIICSLNRDSGFSRRWIWRPLSSWTLRLTLSNRYFGENNASIFSVEKWLVRVFFFLILVSSSSNDDTQTSLCFTAKFTWPSDISSSPTMVIKNYLSVLFLRSHV